jgi:hypothetical protein
VIGPRRAWSGWLDGGHLSLDVVVALVDGELADGPAHRAMAHVDHCLQCAAEVTAQRQARRRLRGASVPGAPTSLLSSLRAIPSSADLPQTPGTLAVDAEGRLVARPESDEPAGMDGADEADVADLDHTARSAPGSWRSRRARRRLAVGVPAAVASGLALGAVTLAAPAAGPAPSSGPARPAAANTAPARTATGPSVVQAGLTLERGHSDGPALPGPGSP